MDHNHYIVTGIVRKGMAHAQTKRVSIVCRNVERAIVLAQEIIKDLEVQSVAHQGQIQKVEV